MADYKEIKITDIKNVNIGNAQDYDNATGCTVLVFDKKAPCGLDVRGGGPASRETQLLDPTASNDGVNAIVLSGGSAYGLDCAGGVMKYLEQKGKGIKVGDAIVPIVVGSCIFDLNCKNHTVRPDAKMGYDACLDSENDDLKQGNVGVGTGATVGKMLGNKHAMKSGLGAYAIQVGRLQVGAIVGVNAIGDVFEMDSNKQLAGLLNHDCTKMISSEEQAIKLLQAKSYFVSNTTIAAIVTNAKLNKSQMKKVAQLASNGIARTIRPVNTSMDGDSVYAASCGNVTSSSDVVGTLAAHALAKAINRAVLEADSCYGFKAARDFI